MVNMIKVDERDSKIKSINADLIKTLSKRIPDITVITFIDGSKIEVDDSIKTLEARIELTHNRESKEGGKGK